MAKSKEVTVKKKNALAADVPKHLQSYKSTGQGLQTSAEDVLIPMARVLDAKSPEVTKGRDQYIRGAEAGDIFIKNGPTPIIKADKGFLFQPCLITKGFVEWLPRGKGGGGGGGFVALHKTMPKDMVMKPHPENAKKLIPVSKATGNPYVETRYYGGYLIPEKGAEGHPMPLVIPFSSSGHSVAKAWNMLTGSKTIGGDLADLWLVIYRVKTKGRTRSDQSWFVFDVMDAGDEDEDGLPTTMWVPTEDYVEAGVKLNKSLGSGQQRFDAGAAGGEDDKGDM